MAAFGARAQGKIAFCRTAALAALLTAAGCAGVQEPTEAPAPPEHSANRAGSGDDRSQWRPHTNADGRSLLAHNTIAQCFVDPDPSQDFAYPRFSVKRESRTIRGTRYEVVNVFDQKQFSEAIYLRSGSSTPLLAVYSTGKCQEDAERLLATHEKSGRR